MTDQLEPLRTELHKLKGKIRRISRETKISYDTVLRIRDDETYEPGFSKIEKLANHLKLRVCVGGKK